MAYDEGLAERIREVLAKVPDVTEKNMFGGVCFLVAGNMCCGVTGDILMARVGPDRYAEYLALPHAREMDFTGKPLKGMIYVDSEGIAEDEDLEAWISRCRDFMKTLPAK
jgi:TfoX/Sxy family transcriptional regulator of competence genes